MDDKKMPIEQEFDHLSYTNSASPTECTGLVTHFSTEEELESYMDIYTYQAIPVKDEKFQKEK